MEDVVDDSKQRTRDKDKEKERRSSSYRDSRRSDKDWDSKEHKERESKDHKERESKDHRRDKDSRHKDREKDHKSSRHRNNDHRDREKDHKSSRDLIDEKSRGRTRDDRHDHDRDRDRKKREEKSRKHENEKRDVSDSDDELQRRRRKREREHRSDSDDAREQRKSRRKESTSRREKHSDEDEGERGRHRDKERDDDDERSRRRHKDRERGRRDEVVEENSRRKSEDSDEEAREKRKKDDMEAEQKRLDEEMEKRRRRVQEWQEMRRKKNDNGGNEAKEGKTWTLDAEDSDEDSEMPEEKKSEEEENNDNGYGNALGNGNAPMDVDKNGTADDDEIDPLDAFMNSLVVPEATLQENMTKKDVAKDDNKNMPKSKVGRIRQGEDSDYESDVGDDEDKNLEDEDDEEFMKRVKKSKVEKLSIVDHSKVQYITFRKNFYFEVKEISSMSVDDVALYRKQLELKIRGKDVPKPIKTWNQTGLTRNVLEVIKKAGFEKPMSIQAQALPAIMSGRDCIGVAKTGSGKTLAFVLPMLRHIKDQPPLASGDGPIGLVMAPTRELVQQIHSDIKKFTKVMGLTCVPVYGGSGVAQQISELKRGTEIVVCTPGRMIDILCTSGGKITNLRRVTYLVMDEADRMFDMGFEPQITRIVQNTRPDRQTVLFSATFPRQVETLARKVLNKPVEIQVGGRSVVNKDITQIIEVRPESDRFLRLLELLGQWYEKGKMLVFVHSQEKCDNLFKDLLRHGYPCLSLHGAKDQTDRESTISDFKSNVCNLLIATSVAARGLDVKELELVVNFDAPNHYEDYVHRVGRTGRAGRKGCAVTFISPDEERYAPDLVKALELSEQPIPEDLKQLADAFMAKVNQGTEHAHGTGYGGSGFKFNEEEEEARRAAKKAQAREYGYEEYDKSDSEDEDESVRKGGNDLAQAQAIAQAAAMAAAASANRSNVPTSTAGVPNPASLPNSTVAVVSNDMTSDPATRAATIVAALNLQHNLAKIQKDAMPEHYEAELEINDFPQNARWKVTHKETLGPISEWTGAAITTRGQYYPPGKIPGPGERKLYLFIEGPTESSVKKAKAEVKRVLEDYTAQALNVPGGVQPGKYSVI